MSNMLERHRKGAEKEYHIDIDNETKIGSGRFSDVYQVDVTVKVGNSERTRPFVLKRYKEGAQAEGLAEASMHNYEAAKAAGLKVFNTYRYLKGEHSIVMTSGNTKDQLCIGTNRESKRVHDFPDAHIESLETSKQFGQLVQAVFDHARFSGEKQIYLPIDAYFFLVDSQSPHDIDFVIGDMDVVLSQQGYCIDHNLENAKTALSRFVRDNFGADAEAAYAIINEQFTKELQQKKSA